jgi:hypothetical protein
LIALVLSNSRKSRLSGGTHLRNAEPYATGFHR